jgi:hypothetical protein
MGWIYEGHHHEGYIAGLVPVGAPDGRWRELDGQEEYVGRVERMRVACDCGWRSPVYHAGQRAQWFPSITELRDERIEEAARQLWLRHVEEADRQAAGPATVLVRLDTWT